MVKMSVPAASAVAVVVDVIVVALTRELQTYVHTNVRTAQAAFSSTRELRAHGES
jgi:hypothetical protein